MLPALRSIPLNIMLNDSGVMDMSRDSQSINHQNVPRSSFLAKTQNPVPSQYIILTRVLRLLEKRYTAPLKGSRSSSFFTIEQRPLKLLRMSTGLTPRYIFREVEKLNTEDLLAQHLGKRGKSSVKLHPRDRYLQRGRFYSYARRQLPGSSGELWNLQFSKIALSGIGLP